MSEEKAIQKIHPLEQELSKKIGNIAQLIPSTASKYITPEKLIKGVMAAAVNAPNILQCTTVSIINAVIISAHLGIPIGGPRGASMVPFKNGKTGRYEITLIPGYKALLDLIYRSPDVVSIDPRVVYEKDKFSLSYGTDESINHTPYLGGDRGEIVGAYAIATLKNGYKKFVYLPKVDIDKARPKKKSNKPTAWDTHYPAMALKTAVLRIVNYLPHLSQEAALASEYEGRMEVGANMDGLFELEKEDYSAVPNTAEPSPQAPTPNRLILSQEAMSAIQAGGATKEIYNDLQSLYEIAGEDNLKTNRDKLEANLSDYLDRQNEQGNNPITAEILNYFTSKLEGLKNG